MREGSIGRMMGVSVLVAMLSGGVGLLLSYHLDLPSGPAIVLAAGGLYLLSLLLAPFGGWLPRVFRSRHLAG